MKLLEQKGTKEDEITKEKRKEEWDDE
jgi:hypothetical protein